MLACIEAGKPVFCEKPLATTQEACLRILEAEMAFGRRLVQVGFMRRYDAGLPRAQGDRGQRRHRRAAADALRPPQPGSCPAHYTSDMAINDTAVHDVDIVRWLLDDEVVAAQVLVPRRNSRAGDAAGPALRPVRDGAAAPSSTSRSRSTSATATISAARSSGETGTASLAESNPVVVKREGSFGGRVPSRLAGAVPRAPSTSSSRNGWATSRAAPPPGPAPGTATPRQPSATPRSRRCTPAPGRRCRCGSVPTSTDRLKRRSAVDDLVASASACPSNP